MLEKVKVLLIDPAFSADLHMDAYNRCTQKATVGAICDKDISRCKSLAERDGLTAYDVYDDVDATIQNTEYDVMDSLEKFSASTGIAIDWVG